MTTHPRPHHCPWCRCLPDETSDDMGTINRKAAFFPLVKLVDSMHGQFGSLQAGRRTTALTQHRRLT